VSTKRPLFQACLGNAMATPGLGDLPGRQDGQRGTYENGPGTVMEAPAGALIARRSSPMQNDTIPVTSERARDLGSAEQHSSSRPPFTRDMGLVELLRPLADQYGTGQVLRAAQQLATDDPAAQASVRRVLGASPLLAELFPTATAAYAA
jgi:hypothetical protein